MLVVVNIDEYWTPIVFKDILPYYEVSSFGNVRKQGKTLNQKVANTGYKAVSLLTNKGSKWVLVHQLVSHHFVFKPELDEELVPHHKDDNKHNNHFLNLVWITRSENVREGHRTGAINNVGENNGQSKVTNEIVHSICSLLEKKYTYDEVMSTLSLGDTKHVRQLLVRIKTGIKWKHISNKYDIPNDRVSLNSKQADVVSKLPQIRNMIQEGHKNSFIVDTIWGKNHPQRKSKCMTVSNIRKGKIYNEY